MPATVPSANTTASAVDSALANPSCSQRWRRARASPNPNHSKGPSASGSVQSRSRNPRSSSLNARSVRLPSMPRSSYRTCITRSLVKTWWHSPRKETCSGWWRRDDPARACEPRSGARAVLFRGGWGRATLRTPSSPEEARREMSTATDERTVVGAVDPRLYVDGRWVEASGGRTLPVEDPATGETLCEVADATVEDARSALDAAVAAQAGWAAHPPRERGEILRRAYQAITARSDDLALLMTLEMGKPVAESRAEIAYAAEFFRWFSEEAVRIDGRYAVAPNGKGRLLTMKQPVGPCLLITPWNFPMAMGTRKIGPAVAAGCTMVVKPAR